MKLTFLTQYYPPEIGAPQARLSELAAHFSQCGHTVTVLTAMPNYPRGVIHEGYSGLLRREPLNGANIIRTFIYPTQSTGVVQRLTNYLSFALSSATLGSFLLERTDFLLVESPPLFLGLSGLWLSKLKSPRLIFNVSDLWPQSAIDLGVLKKGGLTHRAFQRLESFCYGHAWLVTGQSKTILDDIHRRFPSRRVYHLSNGVDTQRFHPCRQSAAFRPILNGRTGCIAFYAGLHGLAQGLDQVLAAALDLRSDPEIHFVLMGDGPQKQALVAQQLQDGLANVHFLEPRPAEQVPALLASADIALVTLKTHLVGAVPSKLYEAMASGRPVILVARGEAADIVRDNQAGIVVEPGRIQDLVEAVRTLRDRPDLRRTLGENGRRVSEREFDRSEIATRFIRYLEENLAA